MELISQGISQKIRQMELSRYSIILGFLALFIFLSIYSDRFLTVGNMINIIRQSSIIGIIACGMTFIIISGNFDLSVGSICGFAGAIAVYTSNNHSIWLAVIIAVAIGATIGLANGLLVTKLFMSSFIVTLGTMVITRGVLLIFSGGYPFSGIKKEFLFSDKYEQVYLLTHSLYFFYELTDTNNERRKKNQKLFRMIKNSDGSKILDMKYEEIQNDYHSYWQIIKDDKQPPALIANCMRNIIEYFFNFIEKKDLNKVFQKPELQDNKYQAFCRYVNRESHSLGQNIFDYKEFDYSNFKEALGLVFQESGYKAHYDEMMKQ